MTTTDKIAQAATLIAGARIAGKTLARLPENIRPADIDEGYLVQDAMIAKFAAAGWGAVAGHKIGATTPVMQQYMQIDHPCAGRIYASTVHPTGVSVPHAKYRRVGIEAEVAVRLARDLTPAHAPFDRAKIYAAIDSYMPAIELVDDRYDDWQTYGTPTLAADDFFGAGSVLGPASVPAKVPDLAAARGRAIVNGAEIASGHGADVMGHPLEALVWLANNFALRGHTLKAGEFISTGSVVKTLWLAAGDHAIVEIEGLGRAEVRFEG